MATSHTAQCDTVNERDLIKITYHVMIHGVTTANASDVEHGVGYHKIEKGETCSQHSRTWLQVRGATVGYFGH
jgi:hypothetical protein